MTNTTGANMIEVGEVLSVYAGRAGACCCGCSGKHSYASAYRNIATRRRGYAVKDDEVSDRSVKLIVGKMNRLVREGLAAASVGYFAGEKSVAVEHGNRVYVAYFVKPKVFSDETIGVQR